MKTAIMVLSEEEAREKIERLGGYDKIYRIKFEADYLAKLTMDGAKERYGDPVPDDVAERLKFELYIMKTMGFPGYFPYCPGFYKHRSQEAPESASVRDVVPLQVVPPLIASVSRR